MINGLSNTDFVLSVLRDGRPHFSREFVRSTEGYDLLLDYRRRISDLRAKGYDIRPLKINGRPGYQLFGKGVVQSEVNGLFELGAMVA